MVHKVSILSLNVATIKKFGVGTIFDNTFFSKIHFPEILLILINIRTTSQLTLIKVLLDCLPNIC